MDYSLLSSDELEEMFNYSTDYLFRLNMETLLSSLDNPERLEKHIELINTRLGKLTPNVITWAFEHKDWRPAQSMTTFIAAGKLTQYVHLVGKQLEKRYFCRPYIYTLARIATPQVIPFLEHFLEQKMTMKVAKSSRNWDIHVDTALVALDWLDEQQTIKSTKDFKESWEIFRTTLIDAHDYNSNLQNILIDNRWNLENTRTKFRATMSFFAKHFD